MEHPFVEKHDAIKTYNDIYTTPMTRKHFNIQLDFRTTLAASVFTFLRDAGLGR